MKLVRGVFAIALATAVGLFILFMITALITKYGGPVGGIGTTVNKWVQPHGL